MKHIDDIEDNYIRDYHKMIGLNVKRIRNEKGISQLDLAHKIGHKSVSIISCAEINHKNNHFNIEHLLKIAYVLEVDICEFFKEIKE
ncbi:helix-turn-helix transcriptional regulator [Aliarcobacter skirrowii]|uniref:helix-turn-helix domain-containing protein n=1 Tax=Aliarcobacter skirrowii TaxID=28200 RepID=UPI0021B4D47D|nr:helix-turn-helix transcriptional regulator [Aliarcobacter skirrowii]MCT7446451.1 helix-turn-helix transcriptional regulator [Aliarcobacter skirrowii]MDX4048014.1 helix-turn-helix transcriptional regulator [Aliarcobacter skirrowii]